MVHMPEVPYLQAKSSTSCDCYQPACCITAFKMPLPDWSLTTAGCAIGVNDMRNPVRPVLRTLSFLPEVCIYIHCTLHLAHFPMQKFLRIILTSSCRPKAR